MRRLSSGQFVLSGSGYLHLSGRKYGPVLYSLFIPRDDHGAGAVTCPRGISRQMPSSKTLSLSIGPGREIMLSEIQEIDGSLFFVFANPFVFVNSSTEQVRS